MRIGNRASQQTALQNLIDYLANTPDFPVIRNGQCWIDYPLPDDIKELPMQYQKELGALYRSPVLRAINVIARGCDITYIDRTQASDQALIKIILQRLSNVEQIRDTRTGAILYQVGK